MARTRPQPLTRKDVVTAARTCLARDGIEGLGVHRVAAELGIKAPSLYNHVDSQEDLKLAVCVEGWREMADRLHAALRSPGKADVLLALAVAFRAFVKENPALYQVMNSVRLRDDDADHVAVGQRIFYVFSQAFAPRQLSPDDFIHAIRALRAAVHGFVHLELNGQFGMPYDIDQSFEWMIAALVRSLRS